MSTSRASRSAGAWSTAVALLAREQRHLRDNRSDLGQLGLALARFGDGQGWSRARSVGCVSTHCSRHVVRPRICGDRGRWDPTAHAALHTALAEMPVLGRTATAIPGLAQLLVVRGGSRRDGWDGLVLMPVSDSRSRLRSCRSPRCRDRPLRLVGRRLARLVLVHEAVGKTGPRTSASISRGDNSVRTFLAQLSLLGTGHSLREQSQVSIPPLRTQALLGYLPDSSASGGSAATRGPELPREPRCSSGAQAEPTVWAGALGLDG